MNSLHEELKDKFPSLLANTALALVFGVLGIFSSLTLDTIVDGLGNLSWLVFVLVAAIFLIRALSNILIIADNAIGLFIKQIGIKERSLRDRILKDLIVIIFIILAFAAIIPILNISVNAGPELATATTIVAIGAIFVFIYDIGRISWRILQTKANRVTNRLMNNSGEKK